jgi:hypothetical protein
MAFNVDEMKNDLLAGGLARPCNYVVYITSPFGDSVRQIAMRCERASLAGRNLATTPHILSGPKREMPYTGMYDDLDLTFMCSESMIERRFFEAWQSKVIDPYSNYVGYYDDYVTDITVFQLGVDGLASYGMTFQETYPKVIVAQELSYEASNSYHKLTITFAYHRHVRVINTGTGGSGLPSDIGSIDIGPGGKPGAYEDVLNDLSKSGSDIADELGNPTEGNNGASGNW